MYGIQPMVVLVVYKFDFPYLVCINQATHDQIIGIEYLIEMYQKSYFALQSFIGNTQIELGSIGRLVNKRAIRIIFGIRE